MSEEPQITTISEKGQVVIPQSIRKQLGIKPKNKFLVYGKGDTIIMKKLEIPDLKKEWDNIFEMMDKKELGISEKEVLEEVKLAEKDQPENRCPMLRVVLDTNVLVSAIISDGKSRELLRRGIANKFSIITSNLILHYDIFFTFI